MGSLGNAVIPVMANGDDRAAQKSYWHEHSAQATVEAMLLDTKAADIDKEERPEVVNVPSLTIAGCSKPCP